MLKFRPIKVQDFETVSNILNKSNIDNCEYCFPTMLVWGHRHPCEIAIEKDTFFLRSEGHEHIWYLYPKGKMDNIESVNLILEDSLSHKKPICIYGFDSEEAEMLKENFFEEFDIKYDRDGSDYVYNQIDLATLPGKKYQKKRNHVSRFLRENPNYNFVKIAPGNINKVKNFVDEWCKKYEHDDDWNFISEKQGIYELLDNYEELKLIGAMIEVDDKVVAITIAAAINSKTVDIIVEKAYHEINGAYAIINRDFASNCLSNFEFINREDDLGLENLRKSKLSYFPCKILDKYTAQSI